MISTITTTTTTTAATISQATVFGAISVAVLISLLIVKELLDASANERAMFLGKIVSVAVYPLLFTFLTIIVMKVLEVI
ncbi:hypothetical protein DRN80_05245 [Methanosarcinales archaeon]|nr:MAG: hypothetical protein DRN80_05245 [Methanosarcinales archaeon]